LKNNREFFDQLQARRYRFMALFRKQAREQVAKPYDDLFKIQVDVRSAAETLIENYRDYINKTPVYGWCEWQVAIRRRGKDDPISKELDRIVVAIETICRPAIQEAASKNQAP
jgi:hypothetical protein